MNVIIWARVSSREQKEEGYSTAAQLRATREKAEKNGWTVVREFEVTESAKRGTERIKFNEMFQWVRSNAKRQGIKAILSHKLDRVCRNMRDAVRLQDLDDTCGVRLEFVENQFGPGAAGVLTFNFMAAVAQYYSDNLRTEVLKGMDEKVRQGWPTGHAPFGYVNNVGNKEEPITSHPEKAVTVARIFELFSTGQYTVENLADKLQTEGHSFRKSQPRFNRTTLSYILNNRFYAGEIVRHGEIHKGKHKLLIDRQVFDACQNILKGKNRRTGNPEIMLSGCVLRCAICGYAVTGEQIRRKLRNGGCNIHTYYKCGHNHAVPEHPKVYWREDAVESAILQELSSIRIPDPETAGWLRDTLKETFESDSKTREQRRGLLLKRRSELANMKDRLVNAYLVATIDEATFKSKTAELKGEAEEVERQLDEAGNVDSSCGETALSVFDFSQNLVDIWRGSNFAGRREVLECVTSNRALSDVSLVLEKRKPFDFLAERAFVKDG